MKVTFKLVMILALASQARTSEACFLDTRYLLKHAFVFTFHFDKNTKKTKEDKPRNLIKYCPHEDNSNLCACHHFDLYLNQIME